MKPGSRRTGIRLGELAARWYDAATLDRYIDPVLADMQAEYEEAVRRGRTWQSRWVWIRGYAAFLTTIVCCGGGRAMRMLHDLSAEDRKALGRTGARCLAIMTAGTLGLAMGPFQSFVDAGRPDAAALFIYLVPQALPLSIPLGLVLGVMWGLGRTGVSLGSRAAVLLAAVALSAASFGVQAWLAPSMNQAFRVAIAGSDVRKGTNELTLVELRRLLVDPSDGRAMPPPEHIRSLALNYHRRWAAACTPFVLTFFALAVIGPGRRARGQLASAAFAAVFGYYALMGAANVLWLGPAIAQAWAPNATVLVVSLALMIAGHQIRAAAEP